ENHLRPGRRHRPAQPGDRGVEAIDPGRKATGPPATARTHATGWGDTTAAVKAIGSVAAFARMRVGRDPRILANAATDHFPRGKRKNPMIAVAMATRTRNTHFSH